MNFFSRLSQSLPQIDHIVLKHTSFHFAVNNLLTVQQLDFLVIVASEHLPPSTA